MTVLIDNKCSLPIYDQIYSQIKAQIISGELQEHEALPSIRNLAKDLRISVITTKRAYDELEKEGFIYTIAAKGCFVAPKNVELLREETLKNIENHIDQIVRLSQSVGLSRAGSSGYGQICHGGLNMNALEIRDLTKHYTGFSLNHLNLTLPWGCIMGLVGENGAGKSTTIKLILNTISRDGGTVTILGHDNRKNLCLSKEEIGVVLDEVGISACLTARQVGKIMQGIYRSWDDAVFYRLSDPSCCPRGQEIQGVFQGHENEAGHCRRPVPPPKASDSGRSHQRP